MGAAPHRCGWVTDDPLYLAYHDTEWGVPSRDETHLFEMLILEGAQAGLSWLTILKKREHYREAFEGFDAERVARFTPAKIEKLLANPGIVRNRAKVNAAVLNARAVLEIRERHGSFADFAWGFADPEPRRTRFGDYRKMPTTTPASDAMSKALLASGCKFVGSTICQSFMQATGMVNDHETRCFRHAEIARLET
jgi:DNA-3-methyladenine glycosylase I